MALAFPEGLDRLDCDPTLDAVNLAVLLDESSGHINETRVKTASRVDRILVLRECRPSFSSALRALDGRIELLSLGHVYSSTRIEARTALTGESTGPV